MSSDEPGILRKTPKAIVDSKEDSIRGSAEVKPLLQPTGRKKKEKASHRGLNHIA